MSLIATLDPETICGEPVDGDENTPCLLPQGHSRELCAREVSA